MKSLKTRLLMGICGAAAVVMIAAAVTLFIFARAYEMAQIDRQVREKMRLIVSMIEIDGSTIELDFEDLDLRDFETPEDGWYLAVWLDGDVLYRSPSLDGASGFQLPALDATSIQWVPLPGEGSGRGMWSVHAPDGGGDTESVTVFLARDGADILTALRVLALGLLVVTAAAVVLMALIAARVIRRGLQPLDALTQAIARIDAGALDSKLQTGDLPSELTPLVVQFNALLARLHEAFDQEKQFCADVAHELRTPLAGLLTTLEVTQSRTRTPQEYAASIHNCREMVTQTQRLVAYLLQIGRLETGQITLDRRPIALHEFAQQCWQRAVADAGNAKTFDVRLHLDEHVQVMADPAILDIVLRNLFGNAVAYVDEGGFVEIRTTKTDTGAQLVVANSGCQLGAEDIDDVFKRFWRGDASRTDTGSHFGLGLPLVKRAVGTLGGELAVEAERGGAFTVTLRL